MEIETPPSISSEKSSAKPGTSSGPETEPAWAVLTGLVDLCPVSSLGRARPALLRDVPPFSTRSYHTSYRFNPKQTFQLTNNPFAVPKG